MSEQLLRTAQYLAERPGGSSPADLCAAISTTYYALFETLAKLTANLFVGEESPDRTEKAWHHVYRSLQHTLIASKCVRTSAYSFPQPIVDFSQFFVTLQKRREKADYQYGYEPDLVSVVADIDRARVKIEKLLEVDVRHLKAFCVFISIDKHRHEEKQNQPEKPAKAG